MRLLPACLFARGERLNIGGSRTLVPISPFNMVLESKSHYYLIINRSIIIAERN